VGRGTVWWSRFVEDASCHCWYVFLKWTAAAVHEWAGLLIEGAFGIIGRWLKPFTRT
jgi:hypothetical protein